MSALWNLGQSVEELIGTRRFVIVYFISGFGGSCLSMLFNPGSTSAGASGAIFGLCGVLFAFFFARRKQMGKEAYLAGTKSAVAFLALNIFLGITFHFDNFCHLGGLLSGFICGTLYLPQGNKSLSKNPVLGIFLLIGAIYALFKYAETVPIDLGGLYYVVAARELLQRDRYAEATELLNNALLKKPNNAEAIYLRGFARLRTKQFQEALSDFEKASAIHPGLTEAVKLRDALKAEFVPVSPSQAKPAP
jgi:rhomboid protease GluP